MEFIEENPPTFTQTNQAVPLPILIPKTSANSFFYQNGLSKIIPRLTLKVHSDLEVCRELWKTFSPQKSLFDDWNFRMAWQDGYDLTPYFYTLYEGEIPVAVLPLTYTYDDSGDKKRFEWFGTNWMEDSTFFVEDEHYIDLLYAIMPAPIHLNAITMTGDWSKKLINESLKGDDPKNIKNISSIKSVEELVAGFKKKDRYRLKADYLHVLGLNPRIVTTEASDLGLLEKMIALNIEQFSTRPDDESDLVIPKRAETYRNMLRNAKNYKVKFIQIFIQNHLAGIDFIITYKDRYYTMKGGIDMNRFQGVSNFLVYHEFEDAIKNKYALVDCLQLDYGWKHRYFDQTPTYLFEK